MPSDTNVISKLLPVPSSAIDCGFSTVLSLTHDIPQVSYVPFDDHALGVHKVTSRTTHNVVKPPISDEQHTEAWEAIFHKGSINPGNKEAPPGGFGFYLRGPDEFSGKLRESDEVLFSYEVLFEPGWIWQKGGKLPGIYGGVGNSAYGCTGGRQTDRCRCFNLRLMWRENGIGELYAYVPQNEANKHNLKLVPPKSRQHPDYGFSVGRGAFKFAPGQWIAVAERVKMNTVGTENGDLFNEMNVCGQIIERSVPLGEIEVFIDGVSVIKATGLVLGESEAPDSRVQGIHFQTFFGGNSPEWASPKNQKAWFTNISGAILRAGRDTTVARPVKDEL
ncbi:hypothetical protein K474DRAFT_1666433 [Panus rudis PR-1116 ss-1]|nr:hypothetical protein K474DRAFT_1666433 [Panus rudis PR-1116 ss-1]